MSVLDAYTQREVALILIVATVIAVLSFQMTDLDVVSRAVTSVFAFVCAVIGGAVGFYVVDTKVAE